MPWRDRIEEDEKGRRRVIVLQRSIVALVTIFLIISMAILVFAAYTGAKDRARLIDCTTPGGDCYSNSEKRTGKAISDIIDAYDGQESQTRRLALIAAACADRPATQTLRQIEACVMQAIGDDG